MDRKSYAQLVWESDIASFENCKRSLEAAKSHGLRSYLVRRMEEIKGKYPRLKNEEIPSV